MIELKVCRRTILILLFVSSTYAEFFDVNKLKSYMKIFDVKDIYINDTSNTLWHGLFKDCAKKATFSCIQKNVYTYLDDTFTDRANITVFDGLVLTKNNLDYHKYSAEYNEQNHAEEENDIDEIHLDDDDDDGEMEKTTKKEEINRSIDDNNIEPTSPLEEVTSALRDKAIKFLATRDYEVQLPEFFFDGAMVKLSPKEVDEDGALIRVDFKQRALSQDGRFFKKIKKFFKSKLLTGFLALLLIIKLIKIKFMFIIPFLFGVGTAKKLFLKLLLFLVPAFAHVFKLCSSYYSGGTKYHHHHHQIAHHHHHVPVPVPIPTYHDHHHPHHHETEEFDGYDYTQPHIQYRKDVEELKEWGIEPYDDPGVINQGPYAYVESAPSPYGMPQYAANARPVIVTPNHLGPFEKYAPQIKYDKPVGPYENPNPNIRHTLNNIGVSQLHKQLGPKPAANLGPIGNHAQNLAYNGYFDDIRFTRAATPVTEPNVAKVPYRPQQSSSFNVKTRPGTTFPKSSGFTAKSDDTDFQHRPSIGGSSISENILRTQNAAQSTVQSPVFLQNGQLGSQSAQNFGQANLNPVKPRQTIPASTQNINNQNSRQSLIKQTNAPTIGIQTVKQDLTVSNQNSAVSKNQIKLYDDDFYGPILVRLEEIFKQLRFVDEDCRERLVCSMYKNPMIYTPHSNLVSNELSREPEELRQGNRESASGRRFQRYLNAARAGQDGGDCLRLYSCHINTE